MVDYTYILSYYRPSTVGGGDGALRPSRPDPNPNPDPIANPGIENPSPPRPRTPDDAVPGGHGWDGWDGVCGWLVVGWSTS